MGPKFVFYYVVMCYMFCFTYVIDQLKRLVSIRMFTKIVITVTGGKTSNDSECYATEELQIESSSKTQSAIAVSTGKFHFLKNKT